MIHFNCPKCARPFHVPEQYAGRRARCRNCSHELVVPTPEAAETEIDAPEPEPQPLPPPAPPPPASAPPPGIGRLVAATVPPPRIRRLIADLQQMQSAFARSSTIRFETISGDPPEVYKIHYNVRGLAPGGEPGADPVPRDTHIAQISLPADYPRMPPQCRMLTPSFHPNIDDSYICIGDHWNAGQRLADLVIRIGEMIGYQSYYTKSPLNGEAAMWADLNPEKLPLDARDLGAA